MTDAAERTDGELLARHLAGDSAAFAELLRRHGPLALAVCRRALGAAEAEDAAQAVFVILARKAASLRSEPSLAGWLHRTARMVCGTALRARARRKLHEEEAAAMRQQNRAGDAPALSAAERAEVLARLDAAVTALPARLREVVALCYLEGVVQSEAARRLGMPLGTVAVYARRGLSRLRERLAPEGAALSVAALGALLAGESAGAAGAIGAQFVSATVAAASGAAAGSKVLALAEGGLKAMFWMKLKVAAAVLGAVTVAGGGAIAVKLAAGEPEKKEEPKAEKKLNPELVNLPPNTWVHIKTTRNPVQRAYSGTCWGNGLLFYFGGGHLPTGYAGNDVELYDVAANTWTQATEMENFQDAPKWPHLTPEEAKKAVDMIAGGSTSNLTSAKGRPLTHHTFQMHTWHPEDKAFYSIVRPHLWAFYPEKREWKRICNKGLGTPLVDIHTWNLRYDPDLKVLFAIVGAGDRPGAYLYDPKADSWAKKCGIPTESWTEVYSTYDAARKLWVAHSGKKPDKGTWWTLNLATGEAKFIAELEDAREKATGQKTPYHQESVSIEYDPESKLVLVIARWTGNWGCDRGPIEVWAYDGVKDQWAEVKLAGPAPQGPPMYDLLEYDPDHKCFLFLNTQGPGKLDGLYAFRFKAPAK